VRAGGTHRRRYAAGLALLFVFAVLFGQSFAAAHMAPSISTEISHSATHMHPVPADMAHGDQDGSCKHRGGPHDLACCISAHCSLLSPWIASAGPALMPVRLGAFVYRDMTAVLPDQLGMAPAIPPPRHPG
jgi:hypothetical protein